MWREKSVDQTVACLKRTNCPWANCTAMFKCAVLKISSCLLHIERISRGVKQYYSVERGRTVCVGGGGIGVWATSSEAKSVQQPPSRRPHQVPRPHPSDRGLPVRPGVVPVRPRHASRRQLPQLPHYYPQDGQPLRRRLRLHTSRIYGHALPRLPGRVLALHYQDGAGVQESYSRILRRIVLLQGGPKFMVQTLRVGTGHCNIHLLYRNAWAQVTLLDPNTTNKRRKKRQSVY
ncbi:uncharacterized protein TNCV_303041 [Trichonephila clavipes]|nr:uncharacterized protein TNCV_303041 [Trichonephila clavipes]